MRATLYDFAHARSGDKGANSNVGLIFRTQAAYDWASTEITAERVKTHFGSVVRGEVVRYELPNLWAFNFILHDSLSGGGSETLQLDAQGKTYGQWLLGMKVDIPENLLA